MANTGDSTPYKQASEQEAREAYGQAQALYDAWADSATASELEEVETGTGVSASYLTMLEAVARIALDRRIPD